MIALDTNVLVYAHREELVKHAPGLLSLRVCRESGVSELLTEDRDFDRFRNFRTRLLDSGKA